MGAGVEQVDGTKVGDARAFQETVAAQCQPFIMRGLCADWPVVEAAAQSPSALISYLARLATDRPGEVFIGTPDIAGRYFYTERLEAFNFERRDMALREGMERILACVEDPERGTAYMGSLPTNSYAPGFEQENHLPFLPAEVVPRIWLGNASYIGCHYDTFDNLAVGVAGKRRFTLFPPDAVGDLYVGPIDRTLSGPPVSLAAAAPLGDPRYPRFERARERAMVVDVLPGDVLYLPKLWWHQVEATEPFNMLVNYWWDAFSYGADAPINAMMLAMIAIAERPPAERAAWRAFFDHYVFRPEGHPLAHLPEEDHGILGPLRKGNYGRIRAMIMQQLRGG